MRKLPVKLTTDLTRYHPSLIKGVEGVTVGRSRMGDRFVMVQFPETTLDILWQSLKITDEDYLAEKKKEYEEYMECLESATNVYRLIGPRGGFRELHFTYTNKEGEEVKDKTGFREKNRELTEFFEERGIKIKEYDADEYWAKNRYA